jgi:hypothetical protein
MGPDSSEFLRLGVRYRWIGLGLAARAESAAGILRTKEEGARQRLRALIY